MTVHRSGTPDIEIPEQTLSALIDSVVARHAERVAVVDAASGQAVSYGELGSRIDGAAAGFRRRGLVPGGVVAIVAANSLEWLIVALGVIRAGGVVTGANRASVADELAHQFRDSGARWVVCSPEVLETVTSAARVAGCVDELVVLDTHVPEIDGFEVVSFAGLTETDGVPALDDIDEAGLDALCALPYSSGTTGRSKGVRLTHRTLVSNICQVAAVAPVEAGDRVLAFLPMFHIMGFAVVALGGLAKGATVVTLPGFEPRSFLDAIQTHRINNVFVVPPIANFLAAHPMVDEFDLSSIETIGCGAAPLGAATEEAVRSRLGCQIAQGYGMTESSGCISYPGFATAAASGSSGGLLPNTEALIVDPATGAPQPVGATGELWFRGPQVFAGYLGNVAATEETIDADGWVHTGDLGHFDEAGHLHITDRLKELIKVKGFQVAPAELEALLLTHPEVVDVAVIGRPDDRAGERPVAYVVAGGSIDTEEVRAWLAARVSEYKQLAAVVITDAIPHNPSGKILRRVLRDADAAIG